MRHDRRQNVTGLTPPQRAIPSVILTDTKIEQTLPSPRLR
jgi:hypothetical protein